MANYGAGVWGYHHYSAPQVLQHRINRYYLGVNRYAANAVTSIEMDVMDITHARWLELLRYFNRVLSLEPDRLPRIILEYDTAQGDRGWLNDISQITEKLHLPQPSHRVLYDLDNAKKSLMHLSREGWWNDAEDKPKLDSYKEFRGKECSNVILQSNLSRIQRSLLSKLSTGTLPLEIETGRYERKWDKDLGKYVKVKREDRLCTICDMKVVGSEYHFLFDCPSLQYERSMFYVQHITDVGQFMLMRDGDKVKYLLTKDKIKGFAEWIEAMYLKRRSIVYKPKK